MGRSKPVGRAKKAVFALLAAVALLLSGCEGSPVGSMVEEMTGGVEGLLSPPRFSEEQDAVYSALSAYLSGAQALLSPGGGKPVRLYPLRAGRQPRRGGGCLLRARVGFGGLAGADGGAG